MTAKDYSSPASPTVVRLDGARTIAVAADTHAALSAALAGADAVVVDCRGTSEADLSLVQLLIAARHSADDAGKTLSLAAPADGPLAQILIDAGIGRDPFWAGQPSGAV